MKYGMTGKILRVDLSNQAHSVEEPDEKIYRTKSGKDLLNKLKLIITSSLIN